MILEPPSGSFLCDGQSLSRAAYPLLFAEIGTVWGSDDGATFKVPDLRGRALYGAGGELALGATDAQAIATRGPKHRHTASATQDAHAHSVGGTGITAPGGANMAVDNYPSNTARSTDSRQPAITVTVGPAGYQQDAAGYAVITYIITAGQ